MSTYTLLNRNHNRRYHQDHQRFPTNKTSRAIQHIQISIVKQTTMHVNQKSISRQIITQKKLFCKLCACKQKHSSVVGRLTETDQIQIRDDTTSRACLRTITVTPGITSATPLPPGSSEIFQTTKYRSRLPAIIAIQHIQISIVKQTTMHVNQKSISRQIITQKKLFFCKLCACKQKHSSVVGRLTETDQIQIRDDTTSRACLRTPCYTGITTTVTTRIISDFQPRKQCHTAHSNIRMHACEPEVNITFKYPVRMQAKTQLSRGTPHRN